MSNVSPALLREEVGRRLRAARIKAGISPDEAAAHLEMSRPNLNRIENAKLGVNVHLVRTMMDLYDFRDDQLLDMVRDSRKPGWWKPFGISDHEFVALEHGASREWDFQDRVVPGLLQTADYARAVFESGGVTRPEEWITDRLNVRLRRQDRLTDEEDPIELTAVVDEHALRKPVGGPSVMQAQLRHLALVSELPTVALHVLPTSVVSNEGLYGNFVVLDFPYCGQPSVAYVSHALGETRSADPDVLKPARIRFEHLMSLALNPDQSVARIEQVSDELWSG